MFAHMHTHAAEYIQYSLCSVLGSVRIYPGLSSFLCLVSSSGAFFFFFSCKTSISLSHKHTPGEARHSYTQAYFDIADNHILLINSFHSFFRTLSAVIPPPSSPLTSPKILI